MDCKKCGKAMRLKSQHRLLIQDCTVKENVERLMGGEKADMVFTDPPYGVSINTRYGDRMKGSAKAQLGDRQTKTYRPIEGDDKSFEPGFVFEIFPPKTPKFLWGANNYADKMPIGNWLVWYKKPTEAMAKMFGWEFELCWTTESAGQVYTIPWAGALGHNKNDDGAEKFHPSQKCVKLICSIFADYEFENIWDGYLGSGSTLIACEKTNRKCFGCEIDEHYSEVIIQRWMKYTGKMAYREDGKSYDEIKNEMP